MPVLLACAVQAYRRRFLPCPCAVSAQSDDCCRAQEMAEQKKEGGKDMLQLLNEVSGAFQPGILTALVGVSGAGKTTLMDVLAGRKTGKPCIFLTMIRLRPSVKVCNWQGYPDGCLAARQLGTSRTVATCHAATPSLSAYSHFTCRQAHSLRNHRGGNEFVLLNFAWQTCVTCQSLRQDVCDCRRFGHW